jgi:hypothetical protein
MDQKGKTADHYLRAQTFQNYDFVSTVNGTDSRKITDENSNIDNRLKSNMKEKSKSRIKPVSKPVKTTKSSVAAVVNDNSIVQNGELIESETTKSSDNQSLKKVSVPARLPSLFDESTGLETTQNESLVQLENKDNKDNHSNEEIESSVGFTTITANEEIDTSVGFTTITPNAEDFSVGFTTITPNAEDSSVVFTTITPNAEDSSVGFTTITPNAEDFVNQTENFGVSNENNINSSNETKLNQVIEDVINDENSDKTVVGKNNSFENKENEPKVPLSEENTESIINNIDESVNEQNNEMPNESVTESMTESMTESKITLKDKEITDSGVENPINEVSKDLNEDSGEKSQMNAEVVKQRSQEISDTTITYDNQNTDAITGGETNNSRSTESIENDTKLETNISENNSDTTTKKQNDIDFDSTTEKLIEANIETKSNDLVEQKEKQESVDTNVESKPRKQSLTGSNKVETRKLSKSLSQQLIEQNSGTKVQQRKSSRSSSQQSTEFDSEAKNQSKASSNASSRQSTQSGKSVTQNRKSIESAKSLQKQSSKSSLKSGKFEVKENSPQVANVISEKVINDSLDTIKNSEDSELWSEVIKEESDAVIKEETDNPNETQIEAKEIDSNVRNKRIESAPNNENVVNNEMTVEAIAQQTVKEKERQLTANDGETENVAVFEDKDIENKTEDIASEATADYDMEGNPKQNTLNQSETLINSDQVINGDLQVTQYISHVGDDQNNKNCDVVDGVKESNKEIKKLDKRESYDSVYNVVGIRKTTNDDVNDDQNKNEMNSRQTPIRPTTAPEERTMSRSDSNTTPYAGMNSYRIKFDSNLKLN